jgi:hypothetical protein
MSSSNSLLRKQHAGALSSSAKMTSTWGRSSAPNTMASKRSDDRLAQALDNLRSTNPPTPFAERWQLLPERKRGGQALVQVSIPLKNAAMLACHSI